MANKRRSRQSADLVTDYPAPRIGIFVCDCGDKIAGMLDVAALCESASGWPGVACAGRAPYWCSPDGRERLAATIRSQALTQVVVAGCSARTHRRLFEETAQPTGLKPSRLSLVNIREGCAWPHRDESRAATARARDQIEMEATRLAALASQPDLTVEIAQAALIIGGGVAGMTAALELADAQVPVTLVERAARLGGATLAPEAASELAAAIQAHPGITTHLESLVTQVSGSAGAYHIQVTHQTTGNPEHARRTMQHGPFGVIIVASGAPDQATEQLARWLRLPQDASGFLPESRMRLRPGDYIERGIHVCGAVHSPCDVSQAQFQAYSAAARALRHLRRGSLTAPPSPAEVDPEKCNGCGDCFNVCPFGAVTMAERPAAADQRPLYTARLWDRKLLTGQQTESARGLSLATIAPLLCTGCGNCVSVCPVGAVSVAGWSDAQLEAQVRVALGGASRHEAHPPVLIFACEWSGYAAAELAGAQQLSYPSQVRLVRLECSGRLQPGLILKAFEMGAGGVLVLGCPPRLCHYERGNERAAAACEQAQRLTTLLGLPPARFQLAWVAPDDGPAFARLVTGFARGLE